MRSAGSSMRFVLALAAVAVVALGVGGAAGSRSTTAFDGAQLSVDSLAFDTQSLVAIDVQLQNTFSSAEAPGLAAYVDVMPPAGYRLDLSAPPGTEIGQLLGTLFAADGSDSTFAHDTIAVDDPTSWAADPVAQACAPGTHTALWHASPTVLGRAISVPIAVDSVAGATGSTYVIRICTTQAATTDFPKGLALETVNLLLPNVATLPSSTGTFRWSALVTPAAPASLAPQTSAQFELRAIERRPNVLTMHARYDGRTNTIVIGGKVVAAGAPWPKVSVSLLEDTTGGTGFPTQLGAVPTAADGTFSLRIPAIQSASISASVSIDAHACTGPSTAPAGCLTETDSPPPSAFATVVVPRATDPRVAIRTGDQARAAWSVLKSTDLPGSVDEGPGPLPCVAFAPKLHQLTETGDAASDIFLAGDGRSAAFASARVLRTEAEAQTDLTGVAQLAALKCEIRESIKDSPGERLLGVGPLRIARVGSSSRAFRAQVLNSVGGRVTIDVLYIRSGRVVITLHTYSAGTTRLSLDLLLARVLAARAAR